MTKRNDLTCHCGTVVPDHHNADTELIGDEHLNRCCDCADSAIAGEDARDQRWFCDECGGLEE